MDNCITTHASAWPVFNYASNQLTVCQMVSQQLQLCIALLILFTQMLVLLLKLKLYEHLNQQ
jgi:hypothetical protein